MALNKTDLEKVDELIGKRISESNEILLESINGVVKETVNEAAQNSESKIIGHIDSFAKEIQDNRDERTVQSEQIKRNTKRVEKLETTVY